MAKHNPLKNNLILKKALSELAAWPMRLIRASWRVDGFDAHPEAKALMDAGDPVIYALWHGRMYLLFKAVPLDQVAILVSPSNDGEFITRIARRIGFRHFVRGSHKRGGTQAILGLRKELLEHRHSIAFTVDGPRGPRYSVKPGIIRLASQTGVPIIPLAAASQHILCRFERSWDHFHAPPPFTRMRMAYGEPLRIAVDLDDDALDAECQRLQDALMALNLTADTQYGFQNRERL